MSRVIDLTGRRFGRLLIVSRSSEKKRSRHARWHCACDCGNDTDVDAGNLRRGKIVSCGCHRREAVISRNTSHGLSKAPEHKVWEMMRRRCLRAQDASFQRYGGRGITIDKDWDRFERFLGDMGPRPSPTHSLDRIDNDGPYAPWNCRWATASEQSHNRRNNTRLTFQGRSLLLSDWARELGVSVNVLGARLQKGWSVERSLTTPLDLSHSQRRPTTRRRPG